MNYNFLLLSACIIFLIPEKSESICVTRRTDWGQFGSFFTDPLCDVWCRIRRCGKGQCREDPATSNTANCVCEKCYRDDDGNVIFPDNDGFQQSRLNFDNSPTSSSPWTMNQRNEDDLYPSQDRYDTDRN
ncbi:AntiBacterial Factor related [Caenorhabditis elegans]|uniref:ABF-5 n=1 Tax=Caenorhabditis elegans TaxID=6239 RepID=G5EFQ2_CAEEL|nr:AntiBacterial Factor related [Caenorhabditis elegans]BAC44992.1 ABF-5 [Caenorhabditis elegans]CAA90673.1 AntiBacterial Factor related [Caenorhabditis elegans]|eukprot:NP_510136.1 AntiBacterial Factor related [Caenorhabditis elegans]